MKVTLSLVYPCQTSPNKHEQWGTTVQLRGPHGHPPPILNVLPWSKDRCAHIKQGLAPELRRLCSGNLCVFIRSCVKAVRWFNRSFAPPYWPVAYPIIWKKTNVENLCADRDKLMLSLSLTPVNPFGPHSVLHECSADDVFFNSPVVPNDHISRWGTLRRSETENGRSLLIIQEMRAEGRICPHSVPKWFYRERKARYGRSVEAT